MEEFEQLPVKLYGEVMKESQMERYLGDELGQSLAESITATISKRVGRATKAIYEIKSIIKDCRYEVTGGILTGIMIWEAAVIPSLLYNSGTWLSMAKKDMERLDKLQTLFFTTIFQVQHSPTCAFYFDLNMLTMQNRILKNKLLLLHHISNLL